MKFLTKPILLWSLLLTGGVFTGCDAITAAADMTKPGSVITEPGSEIVMYKAEGCECCSKWANHMRMAGFTVIENKHENMDVIKSQHAVSKALASCHTAIVDGYVIEGHVPAADVERLLKDKPKIVGLTAPGMPMESPGMQQSGQIPKKYDVFAFYADGKSRVFTRYYDGGKFHEFTAY